MLSGKLAGETIDWAVLICSRRLFSARAASHDVRASDPMWTPQKGLQNKKQNKGKGAWHEGGKGRVALDEKYFRRCDKFDGTPAKLKSWASDSVAAIGSVDQSLAGDVRELLKGRNKIEIEGNRFKPGDIVVSDDNHLKYKGELYSLVVGLA